MANWTTAELAYLAGLVDGEGHFSTSRPGGRTASEGVIFCMADIPILVWVHQHFGGYLSNNYVPNGNTRPRKMLGITRPRDLIVLLPELNPFLVLKRHEGELSLTLARFKHQRPNGRWQPSQKALCDGYRSEIRAAIRARKVTGAREAAGAGA